LALNHLVDLGHRSIAFIGSTPETGERASWESQQRHDAYHRYITAHDLPWSPTWELVATEDLTVAQDDLQHLLAAPQPPTAAFVINDWTAIITLKAALTCGLCIPDDLSLVGFDDIAFSRLYSPGLTTVHQPLDAMGRYAANALLDTIDGLPLSPPPPGSDEEAGASVVFAPTLMRRESCASPTLRRM
jgi:DNA-binding LacI/PurR family transcriptional regulator